MGEELPLSGLVVCAGKRLAVAVSRLPSWLSKPLFVEPLPSYGQILSWPWGAPGEGRPGGLCRGWQCHGDVREQACFGASGAWLMSKV
uniref:Uncharacterized protein n=1 Tax=Oryza barthii TaxID=65489 RepID=A0A0D3FPV0_9ORYZ